MSVKIEDSHDAFLYWERGWKGHEDLQFQRMARLSLAEKLSWLEEAHRLVMQLKACQRIQSDDNS